MYLEKEKYDQMIKEISEHKDFGKRNPVDIGIECGYSEEDIMEMLRALSEQPDSNETTQKYYFMLQKGDKGVIVSVDINTWSVKL